ncbi:hypothetical protein C4D60_Mb09t23630 [Musa balbisiana]|uniref:Pantothenate kinase n=1 Tax=Musa balbisiana TaxID=52838 RepID=A0A4S8IIM9_MUSBA|nr:hypothetical protein C4D60_Mb09t23630 [Musa balbisiana]
MAGCPANLNLGGAEIRGDLDERNPPIFLPNQPPDSSLLALDIGGTLIKLVYFSEGLLHFVKFERRRLHDCLDFIRSKKLISPNGFSAEPSNGHATIKATGGGAFKFTGRFKEILGVSLDKLDEIDSVVAGANFLLKEIPGESFTHMDGKRQAVEIDRNNLFPYLLVNIGSGVGLIKVTGNRKFERVTGTHIGGGTMFGLAKLLTGCLSYDEFLKLSQQGDNLVLDLIVKDICGDLVSEQIAFLVAALLGFNRVFFGGSYIRGHPSTMDNISYAISYWSKGQMQATFLHHEGFLGALGALMSYKELGIEDIEMVDVHLNDKEDQDLHEPSSNSDESVTTEPNEHNIFPYLLVNVGSGVSMIEVIGKWKFERIIGTHLGGGTILGLARLLTGCTSYEEFLELSQRGNNLAVDLTVGDIYGKQGYPKHGLPASTTASSFGKVISNKLSDYKAEDLAAALLNAFTYNIGQISCFVAKLSGLKKIFFRGTYICGHEKIMDKISCSMKYWSKGQLQTTFLCHEGFLGAVGAFWSYENMGIDDFATKEVMKQVLLGAPYIGGNSPSSYSPRQIFNNGGSMNLKKEVERLQNENTELNAEVQRLRNENAELRAKLEKLQQDKSQSS